MLRQKVAQLLAQAVREAQNEGSLPTTSKLPDVEDPRNPDHGDFATNFALVASKEVGMSPRQVAEALLSRLEGIGAFEDTEIAGPGFINLRLKPAFLASFLTDVLEQGAAYAKLAPEHPTSINVEYVSVNPNGPITVGSARGAAFGDTLCNVLAAAGHTVHREYYVNDGVNSEQMKLFAESVRHYVHEANGLASQFPEKGYKGDYVRDVASALGSEAGSHDLGWLQAKSQELMVERQRSDLQAFDVRFDEWFSEQALHDSGQVAKCLENLKGCGVVDDLPYSTEIKVEGKTRREIQNEEQPGGVWLRSAQFGDDKDRVLVRSDGRPTYVAADIAYLQNKLGDRGFEKAIMILGPDHHGYIGRMKAVCQALGYPLERLEIVIFQIVRFVKDGKPAPMRKRDGNIFELRDLIEELGKTTAPDAPRQTQTRVGADVARFFYLMRSHDTHMDFDIDLATKQSEDNPLFYAQYAHARICGVLAKATQGDPAGLGLDGAEALTKSVNSANLSLLTHPRELALAKKILDLPHEVARCAEDYGVHRLTTYAVELARSYHHFYDACRVLSADQKELSRARLALCQAARIGLQATFGLLGVSAPERM